MIYNKLILALAVSAGVFDVAFAAGQGGNGGKGFGGGNQGKGFGGQGAGAGAGAGAAQGGGAATSTAANSTDTTGAAASASSSAATTGGNTGGNAGGNNVLALNPANVQNASDSTGLANAEAGQAASDTDPANFVNFCTGKVLTNGAQVTSGSCNGIVMGDIPASTNMVSTIMTFPQSGQTIPADTDFSVAVQVTNLVAGTFTNPDVTYYAAPQTLKGGNIVGHTHITCQTLGNSLNPTTPPDPATFVFFKGINDAGDGKGGLTAAVGGGLPAGNYRCCTMGSASNHQPLLMPVAQRGAQDDCNKFTVADGAAGVAGASGTADQTSGAAAGGSAANGTETAAASSTAAAASSTAAAGGNKGGNAGGNAGKGQGKGGKFGARSFIA